MEISSDYITLASNIIRSHKKAESVIQRLEAKRPTLLAQLSRAGDKLDSVVERLPNADKRLYRRYMEAKEHLDIYRVAMEERVSQRNRSIIHDTFVNGVPIAETAEKYGLSVSRIKQIRRNGIHAIAAEIMIRDVVKGKIE